MSKASLKNIIQEEFYPSKRRSEPKTRFSVCRKAISDFKKLHPSDDMLADLMVFFDFLATHGLWGKIRPSVTAMS